MTLNDGLPSSLVEAMSLGALPVHSDLSSIREWVTHDVNGLLVNVDDSHAITEAMRKAITDDAFVKNAMEYNQAYTKKHWAGEVVKEKAFSLYREITRKEISN